MSTLNTRMFRHLPALMVAGLVVTVTACSSGTNAGPDAGPDVVAGDAAVDEPGDAGNGGTDAPDAPAQPDGQVERELGCAARKQMPAGEHTATAEITGIELSTGGLSPEFSKDTTSYEAISLHLLDSAQIRVSGEEDAGFLLNGIAFPTNTWIPLCLDKLDATSPIVVTGAAADGSTPTYTIASLPAAFPTLTVTAENPLPGEILMDATGTAQTPSFVVRTDERGRVNFYQMCSKTCQAFQRNVFDDGTVRYTYLAAEDTPLPGIGYAPGKWHVLDDKLREIAAVQLLPANGRPAIAAEAHDMMLLGDDHYVLSAYHGKQVTNIPSLPGETVSVVASVLQEVKAGQVVFDWDSTDHPELYATSVEGNKFDNPAVAWKDYAHFNSITIDPSDGNFVVSFRNQDQVMKLDRTTGDILWRLGGKTDEFGLPANLLFSRQHYARFTPQGTLTIFDNGFDSKSSRGLELSLDQVGKTASLVREVKLPGHFSAFCGSLQRLADSTYFLGWGIHGDGLADATEVDTATDTVNFELTYSKPYFSYRAQKYLLP